MGGRHDRERVEHPQLVRRRVEDDCVLGVEAPPTGEDLLRLAELGSGRRTPALDEERVRATTQLEVGVGHRGDPTAR
jgi:hypothetical protein